MGNFTLTSCRCGRRGARPWQQGARARAGGAGGAARGRHSPTLAGRGASHRRWGKGTRRVQLVRRDGRDVSTLYGREGGGGLASSTPRITSPTRWESGAAGACAGGARGGLRLSRCVAAAASSTSATAPAATPPATRSVAPLPPRSHANAPPSGDSGPPGDPLHQQGSTCPVSTGGGTRRVRLVREEGRGVSSQYGRWEGGVGDLCGVPDPPAPAQLAGDRAAGRCAGSAGRGAGASGPAKLRGGARGTEGRTPRPARMRATRAPAPTNRTAPRQSCTWSTSSSPVSARMLRSCAPSPKASGGAPARPCCASARQSAARRCACASVSSRPMVAASLS